MEGINRWDSIRGFPTGFGEGIWPEDMSRETIVEKLSIDGDHGLLDKDHGFIDPTTY